MTPANLFVTAGFLEVPENQCHRKVSATAILARHQGEGNKRVEVAVGGRQMEQWKKELSAWKGERLFSSLSRLGSDPAAARPSID